ncbi:MAG: hypothetical protein C4335_04275 [Armatimonadota bacterium]
MKQREYSPRTWEGGLLAIIAGTLVWWLDFVLYQLLNVLMLVYGPEASRLGQTDLMTALHTFVLRLPPAYIWRHNLMVGGVVGVLTYWIHTSEAPPEKKRVWRWYLLFGVVLFYFFYAIVGYFQRRYPPLGILILTVKLYGLLFLCMWILWHLMPLIDRVQRILSSETAPRRGLR